MNFSGNDKPIFHCEPCEYVCHMKQHYKQHCTTKKHITNIGQNEQPDNKCTKCGKQYKNRSGLWKHAKQCDAKHSEYVDVIKQLVAGNKELRDFVIGQAVENKGLYLEQKEKYLEQKEMLLEQKEMILEQKRDNAELITKAIENAKPITINNNQSFNINVFLNERCKDALNFNQFVQQFEITHEDLMNTGQLGFVDGVSKIILDNLRQMSIYRRPIHCTDAKRETIYIKDDDKWSRQEDTSKIYDAIQEVSRKSTRTLLGWKRSNPDYADGDSEFSIQCIAMQRNSQAGYERDTLYPKVCKEVVKGILIDKTLV